MVSAFIGKGLVEGAAAVQEYDRNYEMRQAQRQTAQNEQQLSSMKLNEYMANAPARQTQQDLELQQAKSQAYKANADTLRSQTYDSFRMFQSDGNARHLNNFLSQAKTNPAGAKMYGNITRYDNLVQSPTSDQLLKKAGYADPSVVYEDPELSKDLVIVTDNNGEQRVFNMEQAYAGTGYTKHMTDEQLKEQEQRARVQQMLKSGQSSKTISMKEQLVKSIMEDEGISMEEAYKRVQDIETSNTGSGDTKAIAQIAEESGITMLEAAQQYYDAKNAGKGKTDQERYVESELLKGDGRTRAEITADYKNLTQTAGQKEMSTIEGAKTALDDMNFFETNVQDLSVADRAKVHQQIATIEDMRGVKLSTEDKRVLRNTRDLVQLGQTVADKLTPKETGILDKFMGTAKGYLLNEVGGKEGSSAYESFRNTLRNALYGATLSAADIALFESAAGSRNQRFKPAMVQFKTQVTSLKNQLESIRDLNDPYLAQYYIGGSVDDVDRVIEALEERITAVNGALTKSDIPAGDGGIVEMNPAEKVEAASEPTPDGAPKKKSLTDLWAENN